eukprot:m.542297 g.542297  ORF g.542297 m.542297 type:complete len:78 (+) comp22115_c0_seq1:224-457(+)
MSDLSAWHCRLPQMKMSHAPIHTHFHVHMVVAIWIFGEARYSADVSVALCSWLSLALCVGGLVGQHQGPTSTGVCSG